MIDPPPASHREGFQPATLPEAARLLGVSESTVRRMVKSGRLEAEQVLRPQGHVWMVTVPLPSADPPSPSHQPSASEGTHPPAGDALATWTRAVLEPLVTELSLMRQSNERQAGEIATLREERGRHVAELEAGRAEVTRVTAEREAAESSRRRDIRRLSVALAVVAMLAVVAGLAPAWVR